MKENLIDLQERTQAVTVTEVFRKALALLDMVIAHVKSGGSLVLRHKDGRVETVRIL